MTDGIKNVQHAVLQQVVNPLKFCVLQLPFPAKIGIPCMPCELPNEFNLFQANEGYTQLGMKIWEIIEDSNCIQRTICCPAYRSMKLTSKDFYNTIPITAKRGCSFPLLKNLRPELSVNYMDKYIGKVYEPYKNSFCNKIFHKLEIYNDTNQLTYTLVAQLKANYCLFINKFPFCNCKPITYQIYDKYNNLDGEIQHQFFGLYNELCTKADSYGITFPENATEESKTLIVMACVFIDYLQFENF